MRWAGRAEELCFDESLLSDGEVGRRNASGISGSLIAELSFGN